ncbi:MAG: hypothetical protein MRK02_13760 [Candidatus Scalindua sp.]|nr:hypothetical protein [Candidatus Scalindua sp.]
MLKTTDKFQITNSAFARKMLGIIPGSEVGIVPKGGDFVLKVVLIENLKRILRGIHKDKNTSADDLLMRRGLMC